MVIARPLRPKLPVAVVQKLVYSSFGHTVKHLRSTSRNNTVRCPACSGKSIVTDPAIRRIYVRFEVFAAVTMKNGVLWDVTPCGSCKNRRFGGT
jgi:hypothetical protein